MLMAVPKFGRVKAARFLNQCRISQSKTVGGLSERQRTSWSGCCAAERRRPKLFVVTGPSGAGEGHAIQRAARARAADLEVAVSATTRARRAGEVDGRDYYFLSERGVHERVERGEFLEHVVVRVGHRYGTLRSEIERIFGAGRSCVLELETAGARSV